MFQRVQIGLLYLCHRQLSSLCPLVLHCAPVLLCFFQPLRYPATGISYYLFIRVLIPFCP